MKKKIIPVLIVFGLILIVAAGIFLSSIIQKYTPSTERADLNAYFSTDSPDQAAIIFNYTKSGEAATLIDNHIFLDYTFVHDYLNPRFYWDANENVLLYTTANDLIRADAESSSYLITKESVDFGSTIVKATAESALIDIDFVQQYSNFSYMYYDNPSRIVMYNEWGSINVVSASKETVIREKGGIKSPILTDLSPNVNVTVLAEEDNWTKVMTEDGIIGYVRNKFLNEKTTETTSHDFDEEVFSHISREHDICMAWHQVFSMDANSDITSILPNTKGINVISPTWFYLNDNDGNLFSLASLDYVNYCHQQGVEVWALVNNIENQDADSAYVLTHTSTRQNLVNQIVSVAIQYNLDGINLDFESLNGNVVGDSYIQFVRELSLKCENNGIVLSIDNYVPTAYTAFYNRAEQANFADYIVIMGYDEHYAGSEAGSVSSLEWVKEGVANTLKEVPSEQIILGMPFYTRVWCLTPTSDDSDTEILYDVSSEACGMRTAAKLIESNEAEKIWLPECGQFYAEYQKDGLLYKIWLEDTSSADERLRLLDMYSLKGAAFWKLGFETNEIWDTVIKYIN